MNQLKPEERWQRFAAAARHTQQIIPSPPVAGLPPAGLVARVVARAMQARREFVALLWERWSWRVALVTATGALAAGCWVMRQANQPCLDVPSATLEVPALESP